MIIYAIEIFAMYIASLTYSIINDCPKKELKFAGFTGLVSWFFYLIGLNFTDSVLFGNFIATLIVTIFCRVLTIYRKQPLTLYLVPAIIPLVPGKIIFDSLYSLVDGNISLAIEYTIFTLSIACCITLGISMSNIITYKHLKKILNKKDKIWL